MTITILNFLINKSVTIYILIGALLSVSISSCNEDDPVKEDTPELITKATLTFTPEGGGQPVIVSASDPDGEGVQGLEINGTIHLLPNTTYELDIQLLNELAEPSSDAYDVSAEVAAEADEHLFFFEWTGNVFSDPSGNGNIDTRSDNVNYQDNDGNGLPLGLQTQWTTASTSTGGLRVLLKHQPGLKSSTSGSSDGETDMDITWEIVID